MINSFVYFPTIIYRDEQPQWVEFTKQVTEKYFKKQNNDSSFIQTENLVDDVELNFFSEYILKISGDILKNQGYFLEKYNIFLSSLWGQKIFQGSGTDVHIHKKSQLCGWFFLETPENGSYPIYYDPRMNKEIIEMDYIITEQLNVCNSQVHFNNIVPGTILITNSWIKHSLTFHNSKDPTVGLHFIISEKEKLCNI